MRYDELYFLVTKSRFFTWWPWPSTLTFTHDPDITNVHQHTKFDHPKSSGPKDINFYLVIFSPMNYFLVTDGQTDGRRRIRAHRAWAQMGSKIAEVKITFWGGQEHSTFNFQITRNHVQNGTCYFLLTLVVLHWDFPPRSHWASQSQVYCAGPRLHS